MRIAIIGAGAVGSFVGARLALAGCDVTLIGRARLMDALRDRALTLIEPEHPPRTAPVRAAASIAEAFATTDAFDLAFVTVKAYDTGAVVAELSAAGRPLPLISLQNGVGNEEALSSLFGAAQVVAGAIDTPVTLDAPGKVRVHVARYTAGIAPVGPGAPADRAARQLRGAGFAVATVADHRRLKWTKLLLNLPANASCAILDRTPRRAMSHRGIAMLEARAWQEALRVMAGLGVRPIAWARLPLPLLAPILVRLPARTLAGVLGRFVSGGRGDKPPSLQLALAGGRPSEVAWLNGAVVAAGERTGVPTPVNRILADLVSALAHGEEPWPAWRDRPDRLLRAAGL